LPPKKNLNCHRRGGAVISAFCRNFPRHHSAAKTVRIISRIDHQDLTFVFFVNQSHDALLCLVEHFKINKIPIVGILLIDAKKFFRLSTVIHIDKYIILFYTLYKSGELWI
jgi:hypothetical protein